MTVVIKRKSGKKNLSKILDKAMSSRGVDTRKYCGVIKLSKNPLIIQKEFRDEWE